MDAGRVREPAGPRPLEPPALAETRRFDGSDVASSRRARQFVGECLERAGARASWWAVLTGELTANVIRHARTDFDVVVIIDAKSLRVEIRDGVAATDAFRELVAHPPTSAPLRSDGSRGWLLVAATATRFGLDETPTGGKVVWFEVDLE